MSSRRINLVLWTAAALLCTIGVVSVLISMLVPLTERSIVTTQGFVGAMPNRVNPATQSTSSPILAQIERASSLRLRRLLADPESGGRDVPVPLPAGTAPSIGSESPSAVPLTLVGTIGDSLALLRTQAGTVEVRSVGESLGGAVILSVHPRHVQVRINDKIVSLDKPDADANGISTTGAVENGTLPAQPGELAQP